MNCAAILKVTFVNIVYLFCGNICVVLLYVLEDSPDPFCVNSQNSLASKLEALLYLWSQYETLSIG